MQKIMSFFACLLLTSVWVVGQAQTAAVQITNGPKVEATTDSTATIAWTTNVQASSVVRYGDDRNNLEQTGKLAMAPWGGVTENGGVTHRVVVKGLKPDTTYYFEVGSNEAKGTGGHIMSSVIEFHTQGSSSGGGTVPRITSGPVVESVTANTAVIAWSTNLSGSAVVRYGDNRESLEQTGKMALGTYGGQQQNNAYVHRVTIRNLKPNTTYYYEAGTNEIKGASGPKGSNHIMSSVGQFTTKQ